MKIGSKVGAYEVLGPLGKGGMGEVYRGRDSKLDREVAIKVLPDSLARDPQRRIRFEREAKALAALNHSNIAQIYAVESAAANGAYAFIMELVDGETLAARIKRGPIPPDEALRIAQQMASGLEAAHEKGIIHRDFKPGNVMLSPNGQIKILDFGLVGRTASTDPGANPDESPTLTMAATQAGVIMGTAAYMAPEQARGKAVDKRADIWAFGVVLYEMLTGQRLFRGEDLTETLASVVKDQPDLTKLHSEFRKLVSKCLEKDPARRLRDIGDAMELVTQAEPVSNAAKQPASRVPWLAAAALGLGLIALGYRHWIEPAPADAPMVQAEIPLPDGVSIPPPSGNRFAFSPDGSRLAFFGKGADDPSFRIWVHNLQTGAATELSGARSDTSDGSITWSPDGRWITYPAKAGMMKIDPSGGSPQRIGEGSMAVFGPDGSVYLTVPSRNMERVPPDGSAPRPALPLAPGERGQGYRGNFLADGKHFLYISAGKDGSYFVYASLDGTRKDVLKNPGNVMAMLAESGDNTYLLTTLNGELSARQFDPEKGEAFGPPHLLATGIGQGPRWATSGNGLLAVMNDSQANDLTWYDRAGKRSEPIAAGPIRWPRVSPDGKKIVFSRQGRPYLHELPRAITRPLAPQNAIHPVWNPNSESAYFETTVKGQQEMFLVPVDGSPQGKTLYTGQPGVISGVLATSPDGKWLVIVDGSKTLFQSTATGARVPFLDQGILVASYSPDGQWIATTMTIGDRREIFALPVPPEVGGKPGRRREQVSTAGGQNPRWSPAGKEIFYLDDAQQMTSVPVNIGPTGLVLGTPKALFETRLRLNQGDNEYDVTPDGQRFLITQPPPDSAPKSIKLITQWPQVFREPVAPGN